jgi:hypothetical protein
MAYVDIENVTSTILKESYYEALATTELDTKKIDGETVVTELVDVFIVTTAQIKINDLRDILDSRLINQQDFAIRLHALSLALNTDVTDAQLYETLVEYDCHPAFVSVLIEIGKRFVVDTVYLLKNYKKSYYYADELTKYNVAFIDSAANGRTDMMRLLVALGATRWLTRALTRAAGKGQLDAMKLLREWGAIDLDIALAWAAEANQLDAMRLIKTWGVTRYDWAIGWAKSRGQMEALNLIDEWIAADQLKK